MKKIFHFGKKKKGFSPSSSDNGSVLSLGYEIKEKDLGKVHRAASSGDLAKLKQLAKKNDLNQLDKENRTPLHIACANGHVEVVQFLADSKVRLNLCDNQNRSPLMKAVQCQQERCAFILLERDADPNLVDINGNTALHLAASIPSIPLATQLLEHEANIDAQNKDGCSPLTLAVTENHVEMTELLLKEGANVNAKDQAQRTPLMIAACNGQISMISLLLRYDADITVKDEKGWTSDDYAVMNGYHACSHLIIQHGTKKKSQHSTSYLATSKNKGTLGSPALAADVGFSLGRPATNREVDEDNSQAESISRESKCGAGDSWPSSDEDDGLQFKKPQKVNLKKLMSATENARKNVRADFDKSWSESESERESEDEAKGNPAFPLMIPPSGISQHPASPSPASFSKPLLMTSTPLSSSRKVDGKETGLESGHSGKTSAGVQEVFDNDGEDEDDVEESEEEEDEQEEEEDEECEDDEEADDDSEDELTDEGEEDCVAESRIATEVEEREDAPKNIVTKDIQTYISVENDSYAEKTSAEMHYLGLLAKQDGAVPYVLSLERNSVFQEAGNEKVIENQTSCVNCAIPTALDFGDDFVVSAIRVQSRFSDEEESCSNELASPDQSWKYENDNVSNHEGDSSETESLEGLRKPFQLVNTALLNNVEQMGEAEKNSDKEDLISYASSSLKELRTLPLGGKKKVLECNQRDTFRISDDLDTSDENDQNRFAEKCKDGKKHRQKENVLEVNFLTKAKMLLAENLKTMSTGQLCDDEKNKDEQVSVINDNDNLKIHFETETNKFENFRGCKSANESWKGMTGGDKDAEILEHNCPVQPKTLCQQIVRPKSLSEFWGHKKKNNTENFANDDNDHPHSLEIDFGDKPEISLQQSHIAKSPDELGEDETVGIEPRGFDSDFIDVSAQNLQGETLLCKAEELVSSDESYKVEHGDEVEPGIWEDQENQHKLSKSRKISKTEDETILETIFDENSMALQGKSNVEHLLAGESLSNKNEDKDIFNASVIEESSAKSLENEEECNICEKEFLIKPKKLLEGSLRPKSPDGSWEDKSYVVETKLSHEQKVLPQCQVSSCDSLRNKHDKNCSDTVLQTAGLAEISRELQNTKSMSFCKGKHDSEDNETEMPGHNFSRPPLLKDQKNRFKGTVSRTVLGELVSEGMSTDVCCEDKDETENILKEFSARAQALHLCSLNAQWLSGSESSEESQQDKMEAQKDGLDISEQIVLYQQSTEVLCKEAEIDCKEEVSRYKNLSESSFLNLRGLRSSYSTFVEKMFDPIFLEDSSENKKDGKTLEVSDYRNNAAPSHASANLGSRTLKHLCTSLLVRKDVDFKVVHQDKNEDDILDRKLPEHKELLQQIPREGLQSRKSEEFLQLPLDEKVDNCECTFKGTKSLPSQEKISNQFIHPSPFSNSGSSNMNNVQSEGNVEEQKQSDLPVSLIVGHYEGPYDIREHSSKETKENTSEEAATEDADSQIHQMECNIVRGVVEVFKEQHGSYKTVDLFEEEDQVLDSIPHHRIHPANVKGSLDPEKKQEFTQALLEYSDEKSELLQTSDGYGDNEQATGVSDEVDFEGRISHNDGQLGNEVSDGVEEDALAECVDAKGVWCDIPRAFPRVMSLNKQLECTACSEEHPVEEVPQTAIDDVKLDPCPGETQNMLEEEVNGALFENKPGPPQEQDSSEDGYDEEEDKEDDNKEGSNGEDDASETEDGQLGTDERDAHIGIDKIMQKSSTASIDVKRDFLSELGLEGSGDEEEDSPWDSSGSDSPSKKRVPESPAKEKKGKISSSTNNHEDLFYIPSFLRGPRINRMANVEPLRSVGRPGDLKGQASREDSADGLVRKSEELQVQPASASPTPGQDSEIANRKIDLMEELGLGDVDDLEECQKKDSSDWDSSSSGSKNIMGHEEVPSQNLASPALEEKPSADGPVPSQHADSEKDLLSSPILREQTGSSERSRSPSSSPPLPSPRTLTPRSTRQPQYQPQPQPRLIKQPVMAEDEGTSLSDTVPENQESIGCAKPEDLQEGKNELDKAELDLSNPCHPGSVESQNECFHQKGTDEVESDDEEQLSWERRYEKIWVETEKKEVKSQYRNVTAELKEKFGELCLKETGITAPEVPPTLTTEDSCEKEMFVGPTARIPLVPIIEQRESGPEDSISETKDTLLSAQGPNPILSGGLLGEQKTSGHSSNSLVVDQEKWEAAPSTTREELASECGTESYRGRSWGRRSCSEVSVAEDGAVLRSYEKRHDKGTAGDMRSPFYSDEGATSIDQHSASLRLSDEELEEDMQRFKHEVGVLKLVFLDIQNEKAQLQKEVDAEKEQSSDVGKRDVSTDETHRTFAAEPEKIPKPETSQRHLTTRSHCKENATIQDEEKIKIKNGAKEGCLSQNPKRFPTAENAKGKMTEGTEMTDEFDDLTESSDTATEEVDSLASGYRNASLLIKQLDSSSIDPVSMVKLQNMFLEYERTVQREKGRSARLAEKVNQREEEHAELRRSLEETRDAKSSLEHRQMELESDLSNLKFILKQEQEKHRNAIALYDKSREQLRVKEEQYLAKSEEKQKVELTMRNLELEMRALVNSMKQLEEDRNESQRLLARERHARAMQEGILNNHLHKQKEMEEENKKNLNKSNEAMFQLSEASDREKELLQHSSSLQEEVATLRLELEQVRMHGHQEESRLSEENDALKERLEDTKRDLKLNEDALAQTMFQYNGQLSALRGECSVATAKLEHEKQAREKLETEVESVRARLVTALQEVEHAQAARAEAERVCQRERDEGQRVLEKRAIEAASQRESIQSLSQQLGAAEAKANGLENELHRATLSLTERSLLVETAQRERAQAQARLTELEATLQAEREQAERAVARQEATQERLAQVQSETMLLRQQLEESQNRGVIKERAVTDAQERFGELLTKLRADCEERVRMAEDWSKEQVAKNAELQEQLLRQEQEKTERETTLRQLQQELADNLKKLSMCEASLEVNSRYRSDLEAEKLRVQKDTDRLKEKLQESEDNCFQAERRLHELQSLLKDKEREVFATSQKLQEVLSASEAADKTIRQLEEAMQRLEIENARLDAVAKQQTSRIDMLQKGAQEAAVVRNRLEDMVSDLQGSKINLEDLLSREVQKQSELSHNAQDSHQLWEEELKTRSRLALRLAELEREKGELSSQIEIEKKKAKKIAEQKRSMDIRLDQEMKRNTELQKEMYRLKTLVKTAKKKLKEQDGAELGSPMGSLRGELSHRQQESEAAITRMKSRVDELSLQLEREERKCSRLETVNTELKEQLSSLKALSRSNERLERSKRDLEEEVMGLRRRMEAGMMDQSQAEQYRREIEERARQEIRQKLEEVNLFLQTQAASHEALEQMKAASEASLRSQLEQRIQDLESELSRLRSTQQDNVSQKDSVQTQLERYRELYAEEIKLRKGLAAKLERSNERLAEANARLLHERQRSKSLIASSIVNGSLAGPSLEVGPLGSVGTYGGSLGPLNRSLGVGLGGSFLSPVTSEPNSKVEAYLAKMQNELEQNITKELDKATVELEGRTARMSPVGSAGGSQWGLSVDQDPVARATQQYLEVLKKNYKI